MAISNFHISLKKDVYLPGEEIVGEMIMDVWSPTKIKYVDLTIRGTGTVRAFKNSSTFIDKPRSEAYVKERIVLISPPDGASSMVLTQGRYVSSFNYVLPEEVPPSVSQFDVGNGYVFDVSYQVQANVCDGFASSHPLYRSSKQIETKIIKLTKHMFTIRPARNWQSLPRANQPITHSEHLLVSGSCAEGTTSILIQLEKGEVYPVGEHLNLKVVVRSPGRRKVAAIKAHVEQQISGKDVLQKFRRVLIKSENDVRRNRQYVIKSGFSIPIPPSLVPSYLPHCNILNVAYRLHVIVKFQGIGGKVIMKVPLVITPPGDLLKNSQTEAPPTSMFNKPVMPFSSLWKALPSESAVNGSAFPSNGQVPTANHSKNRAQSPGGSSLSQGASTNSSHLEEDFQKQDDRVTTEYKTAVWCCDSCLACCGFGILY